jgi:hypothetical protein
MKTVGVSGFRIFVSIVVSMVATAVVVGLYLAGSPGEERERRFDEERVNGLQQIASAVDYYYQRNGKLPASLIELIRLSATGEYYLTSVNDPKSGEQYGYSPVSGTQYELCATFDRESQQDELQRYPKPIYAPEPYPVLGARSWVHGAGRHCFTITADIGRPKEACGLTNPCQAGQNCIVLPDNKGTACVPLGKECEAAGYPGSCALLESYPVQIRCE